MTTNSVSSVVAVLISQDNLPHIRRWCEYHLNIGFESICLYDNTGSVCSSRKSSVFRSGKYQGERKDKRNLLYPVDYSDSESSFILKDCLSDLPVRIIDWHPRDKEGRLIHGQVEAYSDYIRKNRGLVDWAAFIDIDEYLDFAVGWSYKELFLYCDKLLINRIFLCGKIHNSLKIFSQKVYLKTPPYPYAYKNIVKIRDVLRADIHFYWDLVNMKCFSPSADQYWFNHFNSVEGKKFRGKISYEVDKMGIDESIPI